MMTKRIAFLFCVVAVGVQALLARSDGPGHRSAAVDSLILEGIDLTLRQDYAMADEAFERATRVAPFHPAGYLYLAGLLQTRVVDDFGQLDWTRFDSLLAIAEKLADAWIEKPETRAYGYYYRGSVQAYRSYAASYSGDWLVTVTKGLSAVSDLRHAVELDTTLYDAYAGIGTYEYWKSRKLEFLNWLPLVGDSRDEGVELLEKNYRNGRFNKYVAANSLAEILMDRREYDRSLQVAREVLLVYPDNRVFEWLEARVLERSGRYREACKAYQDILDTAKVRFPTNQYPEILCRLKLAKCLLGLGRIAEAEAELVAIKGISRDRIPEYLSSKAREKRAEAEDLAVQIAKRNEAQGD